MPTRKLLASALAVAALGSVAAGAGPAQAASKAGVKVSIMTDSDTFNGYVRSKRESCASERKVTLYRQVGRKRNPKKDKKAGSDTAQANDDGFQWNIEPPKDGTYYATTAATRRCKAGVSSSLTFEFGAAE